MGPHFITILQLFPNSFSIYSVPAKNGKDCCIKAFLFDQLFTRFLHKWNLTIYVWLSIMMTASSLQRWTINCTYASQTPITKHILKAIQKSTRNANTKTNTMTAKMTKAMAKTMTMTMTMKMTKKTGTLFDSFYESCIEYLASFRRPSVSPFRDFFRIFMSFVSSWAGSGACPNRPYWL